MNVRRAGAFTEPTSDCTATSAYSTHTRPTSAKACAANATDTSNCRHDVISTNARRSCASTRLPANSPHVIAGTALTSPTTPTATDEWVSRYTCNATAKTVICE